MRLICIAGIIAIISFPQFSFGQHPGIEKHRKFLDHLSKEKLYKEKLFYIENLKRVNLTKGFKDSLFIEKAKVFHVLDKSDSVIATIDKIDHGSDLFKENIPLYNLHLIKSNQSNKVKKEIYFPKHTEIINSQSLAVKIIDKTLTEKDTSLRTSDEMKDFVKRYNSIEGKSPLIAGLFSGVIPGSGKWYIGRKWQGITAFIATGLLSLQAYESYRKDGVYSVRFGFSASVLSIFYIGNIWGTVIDAKKIKKEKFLQLNHEIIKHIDLRTKPFCQ